MSYIKAEDLSKQYGSGDAAVMAIHHMDFTVESGEFVSIMGESGAGKSTLLDLFLGLITILLKVLELKLSNQFL